jgi:hypothetical protein
MTKKTGSDINCLKQTILRECEDDHVGLWSIVRDVEESLPDQDESAVREQVLELLRKLLIAHQIKAGFPTSDGRGFQPLNLSPSEVLQRIRAEWPLGHRPTIGEGIWFTRAEGDSHS